MWAKREFSEKVISGLRNTQSPTRGRPACTVSIMEFPNGKVVHETQYFADPFEAPAWRSQVQAEGVTPHEAGLPLSRA